MNRFLRILVLLTVVISCTILVNHQQANAEASGGSQIVTVSAYLVRMDTRDLARLGVDVNSLDSYKETVPLGKLLLFLTNPGKVELIASSRVATESGKKANSVTGKYLQYLEKIGENSYAVRTDKEMTGVSLEATPTIREDGKIDLDYKFTARQLVSRLKVEGAKSLSVGYPMCNTRETKTNVVLNPGEVLIVGGIVSKERRDTEQGSQIAEFLLLQAVLGKLPGE